MGEVPEPGATASRADSPADESWVGATASQVLHSARSFLDTAGLLLAEPTRLQERAREQHQKLHQRAVSEQLRAMPVERLREATSARLRLSDLENAGLDHVLDVVSASPEQLRRYPGIGPKTAEEAVAAAQRIEQTVRRQAVVRFDPDDGNPAQVELLGQLRAVERSEQALARLGSGIQTLTGRAGELARSARRSRSRTRMFLSRSRKRAEALRALGELDALLADPRVPNAHAAAHEVRRATDQPNPDVVWQDYRRRAAVYHALLERISDAAPAAGGPARGALPREVEREISKLSLDTSLLRTSLRGYQAFGAKFAISHKRCIIGDEMGLGKTVEALAAMAHLAAAGHRHFLVVCPASVLVNWVEETGRHSGLVPHSLHGSQRDSVLRTWVRDGGVAVTTYDTLRRFSGLHQVSIAMLVADEAHYVKNPDAKRSRSVGEIVQRTEYALFLSGTPMENRVEEFKHLVSQLQPRVAARIRTEDALSGAENFRRTVAPVYLRRNQQDVLPELPDTLELDDWVELGRVDGIAYREAVKAKDFMAMRRAAYEPGTIASSAKLDRLIDIVQESAANGWKVVVFSYFLDVVESVCTVLGTSAMPPLTGRLSPRAKQELVNEFERHDGHAVLVSQIAAGGVGLNIEQASVVILAEPQLTPSSEKQAIGRCHRMGQIRRVHVHRLMAKDTVDERLQEVLERKELLFDAYVRESTAKTSDAAATDTATVTDELLHDEAVPIEQRILQVESRRLGIG